MTRDLKLNLGCGTKRLGGYCNVDKFGEPDVQHDLEQFPWPWADNSVSEIVLSHILEHLGADTAVFLQIIRELYRICRHNARLFVTVPHPRHDNFLSDPTHVRPITVDLMYLFSKSHNEQWEREGYSNTPLGIYLGVDLEMVHFENILSNEWQTRVQNGDISQSALNFALQHYHNVIEQIRMEIKVIK